MSGGEGLVGDDNVIAKVLVLAVKKEHQDAEERVVGLGGELDTGLDARGAHKVGTVQTNEVLELAEDGVVAVRQSCTLDPDSQVLDVHRGHVSEFIDKNKKESGEEEVCGHTAHCGAHTAQQERPPPLLPPER